MSDLSSRLSLSTCWSSHRHTDGYAMLLEARELGFRQAELSHGTRVDLVPGIIQAVDEGVIAISSVHNFCPLPGSVKHASPNLFQPSSRDKSERSQWLLHSERTLEFAVRVGARHVVLHSGSMTFRFRSPLPVFAAAMESGLARLTKDTSVFGPDEHEFAKARQRLRREAATTIRQVIAAYTDLVPAATRHGLWLGAENREGYPELPLDDGFEDFFKALPPDSPVGYWHDTGHAQIKHLTGLLDHEQHLTRLTDRIIGFHLHDVSMAGKDHQVPGSGSVDFAMISRFVRPEHTLVLEPSPKLTTEEIRTSRDFLLEALG
ncbi:MAG: TIM barrel protein [Verrucomicrobiales bacterium]